MLIQVKTDGHVTILDTNKSESALFLIRRAPKTGHVLRGPPQTHNFPRPWSWLHPDDEGATWTLIRPCIRFWPFRPRGSGTTRSPPPLFLHAAHVGDFWTSDRAAPVAPKRKGPAVHVEWVPHHAPTPHVPLGTRQILGVVCWRDPQPM